MDGGFREALLRQDGIEPGALPDSEWEKLERLRARERRGVRWWKLGTLAAWIVTIGVYVASAVQRPALPNGAAHPTPPQTDQTASRRYSKLFVLRIVMPIEAAAMSIWLYVRTRSIGRRRLRAALLTCETELQALANTRKRSPRPFR